jgi:hypothetical protein
MLCGEEIGRFQKLIKEYLAEVAWAKESELTLTHQHPGVCVAMHMHFVVGAVLSLLAWWLENDMPLSPLQMAQFLLSASGTSSFDSIHRQF